MKGVTIRPCVDGSACLVLIYVTGAFQALWERFVNMAVLTHGIFYKLMSVFFDDMVVTR